MGTTLVVPSSGVNLKVTSSGTGLGGVVTLTDLKDGTVRKTLQNSISDAGLILNNFQGKWLGSVVAGNELRIDIGRDNPPTTRIFTGRVNQLINFQEKATKKDMLEIRAQDYGASLKNITATEDFVNLEVGSIVKSLIAFYAPEITTTNVQTTPRTLARFLCKKKTVFDIFQELADEVGYNFYVDVNKDLHFEPIIRSEETQAQQDTVVISTAAAPTVTTVRLVDYRFWDDTSEMYNQVQVIGDRQLGFNTQLLTANGGSVFTLLSKPHNVTPILLGSKVGPGYINNLSVTPPSGVKFLVDFDAKQVIMLSGTNFGSNIPASGGSIVFDYYISRPLIKQEVDYDSQMQYGIKEKIINDKAIKDPRYAKSLARNFIATHKLPVKIGEVTLATVDNFNPADNITVNLPHIGLSGTKFRAQEVVYNLNKEALLSEQHLKLTLSTRLFKAEDYIHNIVEAIRELQAGDIDPEDTESLGLYFSEDLTINDKNLLIKTKPVEDSFILNSVMNPPMNILQDIERPTNQNFETLSNGSVPSNWTLGGNAVFLAQSGTLINGTVLTGGSIAAMLSHAAGSSATITSDPFTVKVGSNYQVTGWNAQTNNGSVFYQLNFLSGNDALLGSAISPISAGSRSFTRVYFSGVAPAGAASGTLIGKFNDGGVAGSAYFDVTQVTPFTGFGLIGYRSGVATTIYNVADP